MPQVALAPPSVALADAVTLTAFLPLCCLPGAACAMKAASLCWDSTCVLGKQDRVGHDYIQGLYRVQGVYRVDVEQGVTFAVR